MTTDPREDVVRAAVAHALLRPVPVILGIFSLWIGSISGELLPSLLAGLSGYLAAAVVMLFVDPAVESLPGQRPPELPEGVEVRRSRPLPTGLRERYQRVHAAVAEALVLLPRFKGHLPVGPRALGEVPEEFRKLARLLARTPEDGPDRPALEARIDRMEENVVRLRSSLARLVRVGADGDSSLEALEGAADELEALADMSSEEFLE